MVATIGTVKWFLKGMRIQQSSQDRFSIGYGLLNNMLTREQRKEDKLQEKIEHLIYPR
jgi:hypothetical protein